MAGGEKKGAGEEGEREKGMGEGKKKNRKGKEKKNREIFFSIVILNVKVGKTHPIETSEENMQDIKHASLS